jgi:cysteine desulfurase
MAKALEIAYEEREARVAHLKALRDQLINGVLSSVPGVDLTGHPEMRLPSHASFVIDGVESNTLLMHLDIKGVMASSSSACKTGNPEPSDVLLAMGYSAEQALSSLRLTVGVMTSEEDVAYAIDVIGEAVERVRKLHSAVPN